jgi:hypothetical protein
MTTKLYVIAFATAALLSSCMGNDNKVVIDESLVTPASANKAAADSAAQQAIALPQGAVVSNAATVPGTNNVTLTPQNTPIAAAPQPAAAGMNPAHGQPGHRCDIAVGAPLNSKPAQQNVPAAISTAPAAQAAPVNVNMNAQAKPQVTAPGMNPPHGQPGHRCDISVGAPLSSKPAATATPAQPTVTASPISITPVKADSARQ